MEARARARWIAPLACALLAFAAFSPALRAGFVDMDDTQLLVTNEGYRGLDWAHLQWMLSTRRMGHWQPLTWLSYAIDWKLHGLEPAWFHLTNLLLHALDAALVCVLARRLLALARPDAAARNPWGLEGGALFAGLAFGLHPLRAESVVWVTERRDVLSAALLLGALLAWLPARDGRRRPWLALLLQACSLTAKAWGMVLAPVLLVLEVYPLRRLPADPRRWLERAWWPVLLEKLPFLALGLAAAARARWAIDSLPGTVLSWSDWTLGERCVQACYGAWFYLARTLWPAQLSPMVALPSALDPLEGRFLVGYAFVALAPLAFFVLRRRVPALAAAAAVYLLVLAPVLGFMQAGPQLVADRYSYLSCIGWAVVLAAGAWIAWERARVATLAVSVALLAALGVAGFRQAGVWHSTESLWTHAIEVGPPSAIAHQSLSAVLAARGERESAVAQLEQALRIDPESADAWFVLGNLRHMLGAREPAAAAWREAAHYGNPSYLAWMALGKLQRDELRDFDGALESFEQAVKSVEASPPELMNPFAYLALGEELARRGRKDEARARLEVAARYAKTADAARAALARL
ncbi:MAG: tetratricopeptide repeat protein [Planctomycetes bacterium]|nr:tetratricopeptide repeat protein [Planctomycetota bacterium]